MARRIPPASQWLRLMLRVVQLALAAVVLWQAARLVFRPDIADGLRQGDALFAAGRYHDALALYRGLASESPGAALALARRGMIETLRGEHTAASRSLARAIGLGLGGLEHDLARLYQGRAAVAAGMRADAAQVWNTIPARSPLFAFRRVLEAESLLRSGDYAGAEATFRAALEAGLPPEWSALAHGRLAALRASSDVAGALDELALIGAGNNRGATSVEPLVAPLLPSRAPEPRALAAVLRAAPAERPQLLGQLYLESGLYALAEAQFAAVAPDSPGAQSAAAYAAYTRLLAGDRAGGLEQLDALVADRPNDARARALLALAYLDGTDPARAKSQLDAIRALAPRAPNTHLAWGQWYAAQHDYLAAANEYRRALAEAPAAERGVYVLALARFHLDTTVRACEDGRPAAEEAIRLIPGDTGAWIAAAEARLICGDYQGARQAAEVAAHHDPASAEAAFYLGRALALLGDRAAARVALVSAADLAPASNWRQKAESQLLAMGL